MNTVSIKSSSEKIEEKLQFCAGTVSVRCPVCTDYAWEELDWLRPPVGNSHLCICRSCGFITYNPQLEEISDVYDHQEPMPLSYISAYKHKVLTNNPFFRFLEKNNIKLDSFLDYGCSNGYLLKAVKDFYTASNHVCRVKGIEMNRGRANWGKYVYGLDIDIAKGFDNLTDKYDCICLCHVLEHIQKPDEFVRSLLPHLSTNGLLYITLPTLDQTQYPTIDKLFITEHINQFTDNVMFRFLNNLGMEIVFYYRSCHGSYFVSRRRQTDSVYGNYYDHNLQLLRNIAECYKYKALFDSNQQSPDLALKYGLKALEYYDDMHNFLMKISLILPREERIKFYVHYIQKKPYFLYPLGVGLGGVFYEQKMFNEAEQMLTGVIDAHGPVFDAVVNLYHIAVEKKDYPSAIRYLQILIEHNPYNTEYVELLSRLMTLV